MSELSYTLLADGSSDRALIPILTWTLREHTVNRAIQPYWADLWRLPERPKTLSAKIEKSVELYPSDLLFVHRDAEGETRDVRVDEINTALQRANQNGNVPPIVCVIPVRMQEAWLLLQEAAIRSAVGNPNGRQPLNLPNTNRIESLPDPKQTLYDALRAASQLGPRRLRSFRPSIHAQRVSEHMHNFDVLRDLPAFNLFEAELRGVLREQEWDS